MPKPNTPPETLTITLIIDKPKGEYTDEQLREWVEYHVKVWPFLYKGNPLNTDDFVPMPKTLTITKNTLL